MWNHSGRQMQGRDRLNNRHTQVRLAVVGAGLIGRRHVDAIGKSNAAVVAAIADPTDEARAFAAARDLPWFPDLATLAATARPDGVVLATPNQMHVAQGLECVAMGLPMLIEKPIATSVAEGMRLVHAASGAAVPVLVGHHRRHNPLIAAAREALDQGQIGRLTNVQATFWLMKPDDYFETHWRRMPGAGPVLLNAIHDIDLLRHLCGEVTTVQAMTSDDHRGFAVEDGAVVLLRFANGALGTLSISDATVAPWSWELTAAENPAYPVTGQSCYLLGGSRGSLELPNLASWRNQGVRSWWEPIDRTAIPVEDADPLIRQIVHFRDVIQGAAAPLVSGLEGLRTLAVVEAILSAATAGEPVHLPVLE